MTRWGKVDYKQFAEFSKKLNQLAAGDMQQFCESAAKELAARLLAKVIKRTPVGVYPANTGMVGGTLRRGWTGGSDAGAAYAESLPVEKTGNTYTITISNPVEYAPYVEYGHRTANHKGWVEGRFMLTESEIELDGQMPGILEKKLTAFLGEYLNGK